MKQKVLITGASGFIGLHLVDAALDAGLDVYTGIRKTSNIAQFSEYSITHTYPDYGDLESLEKELELRQYDYIIHAAGVTKARSEALYNSINGEYTFNLVRAAVNAKISLQKIVLISSLASIGPLNEANSCITGDTLPQPVTAYGRSKLLAELKLKESGIPWIILRPTAVYGPGEKDIFLVFKMISRGVEAYIGKGEQKLSFVYVKDLARVAVKALFAPASREDYNITDGHAYSRYALADTIKAYLNKKSLRFHLPYTAVKGVAAVMEKLYERFNRTAVVNREKLLELTGANWTCDISKARRELGFSPEYDLKNGVKETIDWYKQQRWL
ncbi:MAG: NAD(P)-dependent oxidoreductase [Chitinophagaceae bacterium]|nr:NAD(P)-dependent oxidoreductase [Chitinophagaceae bacterium]